MDDISIQVDTKDLEAMLKALPEKIARRYMKNALQAGGDVILDAMVATAPERTDEVTPEGTSLPPGILKYDLSAQVIQGDNGGKVRVGPTTVAGAVARWQNNGWIQTGHKPGKKKGRFVDDQPGKYFIQRAFDETAESALDAFIETLSAQLNGGGE